MGVEHEKYLVCAPSHDRHIVEDFSGIFRIDTIQFTGIDTHMSIMNVLKFSYNIDGNVYRRVKPRTTESASSSKKNFEEHVQNGLPT